MASTKLSVDGAPVSDLWNWSLMWLMLPGGGNEPVLYHRGKRVLKPWKMHLEADLPKDPWGGSAGGHTAEDKDG